MTTLMMTTLKENGGISYLNKGKKENDKRQREVFEAKMNRCSSFALLCPLQAWWNRYIQSSMLHWNLFIDVLACIDAKIHLKASVSVCAHVDSFWLDSPMASVPATSKVLYVIKRQVQWKSRLLCVYVICSCVVVLFGQVVHLLGTSPWVRLPACTYCLFDINDLFLIDWCLYFEDSFLWNGWLLWWGSFFGGNG